MKTINVKLQKKVNANHYNKNVGDVINIPLQEYIYGVVAAQIGNSPLEACCAQAIASRTTAYPYYSTGKTISDSSPQCFNASRMSGQYLIAQKAALKTQNILVCINTKPCSPCSFSANNGGKTTSSQQRWGGYRSWLIQQQDVFDSPPKKGHGVGLSQKGAINRANAGHSYKQILQFYYPGTQLIGDDESMTDKQKLIVNWCLSKVGLGYIYGATGWICSPQRRQTQANQYPEYRDTIMNVGKKWDGVQCYDCAQFTRYAAKQAGYQLVSGANSQWTKVNWDQSGTISNLPKDKVCFLYRMSGSKMAHTGVYLGDGTFIHAKGTSYGILHQKLGKYPWTHYATFNWKEEHNMSAKYKVNSNGSLNLRSSASATASRLVQIPSGTVIECQDYNSEWKKTAYNGKTGYVMSKYLTEYSQSTPQPEPEEYVTIKIPRNQAQDLFKLLKEAL